MMTGLFFAFIFTAFSGRIFSTPIRNFAIMMIVVYRRACSKNPHCHSAVGEESPTFVEFLARRRINNQYSHYFKSFKCWIFLDFSTKFLILLKSQFINLTIDIRHHCKIK
jgi:hypothetical protein